MVQVIQRKPDLGTQLGSGIARGLSEQAPKELERYRLSQGLKNLKADGDPFQTFAELSAIPGITPQMIQTAGELLKQRGIRNSFRNAARQNDIPQQTNRTGMPSVSDIQFGNTTGKPQSNLIQENQDENQIVQTNPLRPEAEPRIPWSLDEKNNAIADILEQFPYLNLEQAREMANEQEKRYLETPSAYQAQEDYRKQQRSNLESELSKQLKLKLGKDDISESIRGEDVNRALRAAESELVNNPKSNINDIANRMSDALLDFDKAKVQLKSLTGMGAWEKYFKGSQLLDSLKEYQEAFDKVGAADELYTILQKDFGLSPDAAAVPAYPVNEKIYNYLEKLRPQGVKQNLSVNIEKALGNSRKYARHLSKMMTSKDSYQALAKYLSEYDKFFNPQEFFNELRELRDNGELLINPRLSREIAEGKKDIFPNWADIQIFPRTPIKPFKQRKK